MLSKMTKEDESSAYLKNVEMRPSVTLFKESFIEKFSAPSLTLLTSGPISNSESSGTLNIMYKPKRTKIITTVTRFEISKSRT